MNSDTLNNTMGKAFIRLLTLGLLWSVFFALYKISGNYDPGLVSVILFLLGIYAFSEVLSVIIDEILRRKQQNLNHTTHDLSKDKLHKGKKDM